MTKPKQEQPKGNTTLLNHAERELKNAGLFDSKSDYDGNLGKWAMELIKVYANQKHSGASAAMTVELFVALSAFLPLGPLTDNPDEWVSVSTDFGRPMWQSKRNPAVFSEDGGKTYKDMRNNVMGTSVSHKQAKKEGSDGKSKDTGSKPEAPKATGKEPTKRN